MLTANVSGSASGGALGYQWLRDGGAINGATSSSYTLIAADAGHELEVQVTEAEAGYVSTLSASNSLRILGEPFKKTVTPMIAGTVVVGRTVTVKIGTWSPDATFSIQWLLDGRATRGAVHRSLVIAHHDAGKKLSVRVTGTRAGYTTHEVTSRKLVVHKAPAKARKPRISGRTRVGETLHAHVADWLPGTQFSYRWYAGNSVVAEVTGHSLRLQPEHRGKRITLEVIGRLDGQEDVSARSAQTRAVRRSWAWL